MKRIILGVGLMLAMIGCSSDVEDEILNSSIDTTWSLKKISGGLAGVNLNYDSGEVYWIFNSANNTLTIENNLVSNGPKMSHGGPVSGVYSFVLNSTDSVLYIQNMKRGRVFLTASGGLNIDDNVATDGLLTEFVPGVLQ